VRDRLDLRRAPLALCLDLDRVAKHATHEVVAEDDDLLGEELDATGVASQGDVMGQLEQVLGELTR
jgi:hypothetical protein